MHASVFRGEFFIPSPCCVQDLSCATVYTCVFFFFIAMDCDTLSDPANGQVSHSRTTLGQTANYSCNTGYNLVGDSTHMRQAMGWSGSAPTCQGTFFLCACVVWGKYLDLFICPRKIVNTLYMYHVQMHKKPIMHVIHTE